MLSCSDLISFIGLFEEDAEVASLLLLFAPGSLLLLELTDARLPVEELCPEVVEEEEATAELPTLLSVLFPSSLVFSFREDKELSCLELVEKDEVLVRLRTVVIVESSALEAASPDVAVEVAEAELVLPTFDIEKDLSCLLPVEEEEPRRDIVSDCRRERDVSDESVFALLPVGGALVEEASSFNSKK